jgi:hypothetical protein
MGGTRLPARRAGRFRQKDEVRGWRRLKIYAGTNSTTSANERCLTSPRCPIDDGQAHSKGTLLRQEEGPGEVVAGALWPRKDPGGFN